MSNENDSNGQSPDAVEKYLYDLTGNYHYRNENVDVKLGNRSYAALDGSHIGISQHFGADLSGPQRLRLQGDTTSHEVYHLNESDLESKKTFSEENDVAPKTAGAVINIVEDHYVDHRRTTDFPGQRKSLAYKLQVQIDEADNPKFYHIDNQPNKAKALVNGLLQVSALGFPLFDDEDAIDDDVLDFLTWARAKVKEVRELTPENVSDEDITKKFTASGDPTPQYKRAMNEAQDAREEVAQEIFDTLMGHLDDPSKADDHVQDTGMFKFEIPDDVDMRPMTPDEREEFDKKKEDMPTVPMDMDMDMDGDDGDSASEGDDADQQGGGGGGGGGQSGSSGDDQQDADDQQGGGGGDGDEQSDEGDEQDGGAGGTGDDQQDGDEDGDGDGQGGDAGDDEGDGDEDSGADGAGGDDQPPTCSDCGKPLVKKPRREVENQGAMSDESGNLVTDGGTDMVYVCPDCGEVVDPETGEHQGDGAQDGDEGDDADDQQGGGGGDGDQQGDESDQQDGDGQGGDGDQQGDDDGDTEGDGDGDESGDSDGDADGESDGEGGSDDGDGQQDGDEGDEPGDGDGDADGDGDGQDGDDADQQGGGGSSDPLSEEDNTHYDDERHDTQHIDRDELARERDDMLNLGRAKDVKSFWGVDDREDVSDVESRFVRRWQKIKVEENADEDSLVTREKARDERMSRPVAAIDHGEIRDEVMNDGLADAIEEAFRELKTRDRYQPSRAGEDLDMNRVVTNRAMGYEAEPNYKHKQRAEKGDRAVGVALDMSNSMNEKKAKVALGGLYVATDIIGDTLTASAFHTNKKGGLGSNADHDVHTPLVTGPDEQFKWQHLDAIRPKDWTPTPSGIIDAKKLLKQASRPEKVLIVITDGKPNVMPDGDHSGNKALDASATAVQQARHEGIKVIGLGVGNIDEGNMQAMFGANGYVMSTSMNTLAKDLLRVYKRQMKVVQEN